MNAMEQLKKLVKIGNRFRNTPIVDDDFTRLRDQFDCELSRATEFLKRDRPIKVCLIGSSRFMKEHMEALRRLTLEGKIVLPMGMFGHNEAGFDMEGSVKQMLDELHLRKIDESDEVFVVNPTTMICPKCRKPCSSVPTECCHYPHGEMEPYIGDSTKREIAYTQAHNKPIIYLEEMENTND